jgi:hypothetical protein
LGGELLYKLVKLALRRKVQYLRNRGVKEKTTPRKMSGASIESVTMVVSKMSCSNHRSGVGKHVKHGLAACMATPIKQQKHWAAQTTSQIQGYVI